MPVCIRVVDSAGLLDSAGEVISGSAGLLYADINTSDLSQCPLVAVTGAEYVSNGGSLWDLTPDQALGVSAAIVGLWALAWGIKQVARVLKGDGNEAID